MGLQVYILCNVCTGAGRGYKALPMRRDLLYNSPSCARCDENQVQQVQQLSDLIDKGGGASRLC